MFSIRSSVASLVIFSVTAAATAQSLGAVAKKEQERRKAAPAKPAKTYTETDLAEGRPADAPETPANASPAGETSAGTQEPTPQRKRTSGGTEIGAAAESNPEAYWRFRFAEARNAIAVAEARVKRWEKAGTRARTNGGTLQLKDCSSRRAEAKPGDRIRLSTCDAADTTFMGELEAARRAVVDAKAALASLEDEARRNGALPAWTR